jgi:hypothetical protein
LKRFNIIQAPRLWTPADLPIGTLSVWLDAADSSTITIATGVSQWRDKSGNDAHATQTTAANQPAYSQTGFFGLPGITFDGSNDSLSISTTQNQNTTHGVYWVFVRRGAGTGADTYRPSVSVLTSSSDRGGLHYVKNSNNFGASYPYYSGSSLFSYDLGSGTAYNNTNAQVMAFQSNVTGWGVWRNGSLEGTTNGISAPNNMNLGFTLAAQANAPRFSNITMTDFILLRTTNTSIRQIVEGYLAWNRGLTANLPTAHPFKNRPPLVSDV